ncbi:TIGR02234 family membrane protein, partial [Streptomyces sp. SID10115]|nr:TIGR02234 family membrane protein [Streptomyces sp. SID10115]
MTSAVPPPRTEDTTESPAQRSSRRSIAAALLLGAVGAALALLASRQAWAHGTASVA